MESNQFVNAIASIRKSATFMTLRGYKSDVSGEISNFSIIFHFSYEKCLYRSIQILELYKSRSEIALDRELEIQAKEELLLSFHNSISEMKKYNIDELEDGYSRFKDEKGEHIKGIKYHDKSETLHLFGLFHSKRVIEPGIYKKVNKRPLTIAKDKLRKLCPASNFRQFKVKPENLDSIAVENRVFSFEDLGYNFPE